MNCSIKLLKTSLGISALGALTVLVSSCASDPLPDIVHPIDEPIQIPTPAETNTDLVPDPIDTTELTPVSPEFTAPALIATPVAKRVPGRPGFVFNPYTQNMVDVDGIPSGTKVRDPQDSNEAHTFKVP